jgi:hypothetical protein
MDKNISLPLLVRGKGVKPSHEITSTKKPLFNCEIKE